MSEFVLPASVISKSDISRLVIELEWVDNEITAAAVRAGVGSESGSQPVYSVQLNDFLDKNKLSLEKGSERSELIKQLRAFKSDAPVIHMTFAGAADRESLEQLTAWVREQVNPQALIAVGVQPSLVGGVYIRTPNKVHDLSLRHAFDGRRDVLVKELEALRVGK